MKKNTEEIIENAVKKAACYGGDRTEIARIAARLADEEGVNVMTTPWRQDVFYSALDKFA